MSNNIVERLRGHPGEGQTVTEQFRNMVEQRHEAADEIERLRAALAAIGQITTYDTGAGYGSIAMIVGRALEPPFDKGSGP